MEILPPSSSSWAPVPVQPTTSTSTEEPPPILVNIGDLLSYWTDGLLKSTIHRVVFPLEEQRKPNPKDRYSIAYFCHPTNSTELVPLPSPVVTAYRQQQQRQQNGHDTTTMVGYGGGAGSLLPGNNKRRTLTALEHLESRLNATYNFKK